VDHLNDRDLAGPLPWEGRFTAPQIGFPSWSAAAPERLAFASSESGSWQVWTLDLGSGARSRITDEPVGVEEALVAPDGRVVWWRDDVGNETGRWMAAAFDGSGAHPLIPDLPTGWRVGISFADTGGVALGLSTDDDYRAYFVPPGGPPTLLRMSRAPIGVGRLDPPGVGGLSSDSRLVCLRHSEHGDIVHEALRVVDTTGETVGEQVDPGSHLDPVAWSPIAGDERLLFTSEREAFERPAIWNLANGERQDLVIDLPGAVIPVDWWPDGSSILARHEFEGADQLVRIDLGSRTPTLVWSSDGEILGAAVRPEGSVWLLNSDASRVPCVVADDGRDVIIPPGEPVAPGRSRSPMWFEAPNGQRVQAFVVTPPGDGPWPTVLSVHGGPAWHERGGSDAETDAFVDAGYAVAIPNYRGSTGYGVEFRRALVGNPWLPETEDVIACLDALVSTGITDPDRVAFAGWSWGGCLACLAAGLHPDRWKAVFAGIPSGDLVAAHHACMPEIRAYDLALFGGSPEELPEMWAERNPMTYVDRVRAPVLVIAGDNDPRCPPEGIVPWVEALRARGIVVDTHFYPEGHHANATAQQVHHMRLILDFFARYV
jgi:dipeptidyl aminopeptidase/acylaminoacyl peptidase